MTKHVREQLIRPEEVAVHIPQSQPVLNGENPRYYEYDYIDDNEVPDNGTKSDHGRDKRLFDRKVAGSIGG